MKNSPVKLIIITLTCFIITRAQGMQINSKQTDTIFFKLSDTSFTVGGVYRVTDRLFEFNSSMLNEKGLKVLDSLFLFMIQNPKITLEIRTHLSNISNDFSLDLSDKRANEIANYLIKKGIDPKRLLPKGYGDTLPLYSDKEINEHSPEEQEKLHELNRRTDFVIYQIDN